MKKNKKDKKVEIKTEDIIEDKVEATEKKLTKKETIIKFIKDAIPYLVIIICVVLFRTYVATLARVNGSSMYDTLEHGEIVLVNKLADYNRYDIVTTDKETDSLIKRVYGLPGETISCKNNVIYINGEAIEDNYAFGDTGSFDEVTLGEDEYFLLGDNRLISMDSRTIGAVNVEHIKGVVTYRILPLSKFGTIDKD